MKIKALLVDDETEMLDLLQQIVEGMGYECLLASNGADALEILRAEKVDVMVTDIVMPVMDGWTLATRVKEEYPDVRIVGISGRVEPRAGESPFDVFADKPFSLHALRDGIRRLTEGETLPATPAPPISETHRMRICLVGEESIATQTLQEFLSDLGHNVISVRSSHELLDQLKFRSADVMIANLGMAGNDTWIREVHRRYPEVAIVLMTTGHPSLSAEEALSYGVYAYLHKPISLAELELLLVRLSERHAEGRA